MLSIRSLGWILIAVSWLLAAGLLLRPQEPNGGIVAVVFPPWTPADAQLNSLISNDLYLVERRSPMILLGYAPDGWTGTDRLLSDGAITVFNSNSFSLCTPAALGGTGPTGWDI